jgi:serine/threonine protein phosphatase PrpC
MNNQTAPLELDRPFVVRSFGATDTGRVRPSNEDQFLIAELTKAMRIWQTSMAEPLARFGDERAHLFLVADGMGGHAAGEEASALAIAAVERFALNTLKWFFHSGRADTQRILREFQAALREADVQIIHEAALHPKLSGMGTTLTMAYHIDQQLCVAHVGDSRAYLYRGDELQQITQDHTVTAEMVRLGQLREDEVSHHRLRHVITNVVGGTEAGVYVEAHALELRPGDRLLICSDGLTEMITNDAIVATLKQHREPEAACIALLAQANDAGGRDNITAVVADFDRPEAGTHQRTPPDA